MSDWKTKALAAVESGEKKRRLQKTRWGSQFHIRMTTQFKSMVWQAAEARGITLVGYMRRAIAKQVAIDLGLDWDEVIIHSPYPAPFGHVLPDDDHRISVLRERRDGQLHPSMECAPDDGTGYGDWS